MTRIGNLLAFIFAFSCGGAQPGPEPEPQEGPTHGSVVPAPQDLPKPALVVSDPWVEPQDTRMAMNSPDEYAWRLFVALNWPAKTITCSADSAMKLGADGPVVWETWRSKTKTFLPKAKAPSSWDEACAADDSSLKVLTPPSELMAVREQLLALPEKDRPLFDPPVGSFSTANDEEVRLNRATYEFVRSTKLYDLTEQERLAASGLLAVDFPLDAKEVKAHWVEIESVDKPRYHWSTVNLQGTEKIYGLVALHIITRDMPRWFWSTFEHVDNESRWPTKYPDGFRGWIVASRDSFACSANDLGCNKIPAGLGLEGTKWEHYRLRGTQIDWVDDHGNPTVLVNSKIEGGFDQRTMSCMTCHALAVKGNIGRSMPVQIITAEANEEGRPKGYIGAADLPGLLKPRPPASTYLDLDFVWSLRNAQRP